MGSRGRSIRLRIYFLVAIPLIAMIGLLAYVTSTQVDNAINLDRAPSLINATSLPATKFGNFLETERAAAVIYLSSPSAGNLRAYQAAIAATNADEPAFRAAMTSPETVSSETPDEAKAISAIMASLSNLTTLRNGVQARALSPLDALNLYSQGIAAQPKLFLLMTNSEAATSQQGQAIGLITIVQAREELSQEQALLSGALAAHQLTRQDRIAFTNTAATRQADLQYAQFVLTPANLATYNAQQAGSAPLQQQLGTIEQAVEGGTSISQLPITSDQWQSLTGTLLRDEYNGGVAISRAILASDHQTTHAAWVRVAVTGGIALLGLIITVLLTSLVGRSIIRRLRGLETSALILAQDQLPDVISRLRHGEDVDVASEAPPLRAGASSGSMSPGPASPGSAGNDEIGRVSQAFDLVRQTALRAAVDEARLRQGLNDVFRSLARRSQSLLHRQLTLLDQMERRASDPEALDDLFRLDHLTTRMRRHAEGLVILAGAPPNRGWSSPVRMVDVIRGAVAEVEDYARVSVATRSQAALAGSAVADVIHLLAELIENATTLSPPYTSVRVSGDTVANGFAIEVEDRGLGMNGQRLAELNDRLARPPEFNPSDSEQLGLFVVGQLAKRHGVRVTLKASPYGGTAAIVLIPRHLIVTDEALEAGLPGQPAAIAMSGAGGTNGHRRPVADTDPGIPRVVIPYAGLAGAGFGPMGRDGAESPEALPGLLGVPGPDDAPWLAQSPGVRISGPLRDVPEKGGTGAYASAPVPPAPTFSPAPETVNGGGSGGLPHRHPDQPPADGAGSAPGGAGAAGGLDAAAAEPATFDAFMPRHRRDPAVPASPGPSAPADRTGAPLTTPGAAAAGAAMPEVAAQPQAFPGWTVPGMPSGSAGRGAPAGGGPAGPATPMKPVASARPGLPSAPPWELAPGTGPAGTDAAEAADEAEDPGGLPRRVKQASLAPQLRADPPQRRTIVASGGPVGGPSPAEIRRTMSALQRGWQEGRSQNAGPGGGPLVPTFTPAEDAAPGPAAPGRAESAGATEGADTEIQGDPDDV